MSGITLTLRALHHGERDLERRLLAVAERHRTDHEVHHVATDVARWSRHHAERLARIAPHYGLDLSGPADEPSPDVPAGLPEKAALRERAAEAVGSRPEPGLLLLDDLRDLHLAACGNSLRWEMLAQAARATVDQRLLAVATDCHPETLRQMRWTNTMIKTLAPQLLTSL